MTHYASKHVSGWWRLRCRPGCALIQRIGALVLFLNAFALSHATTTLHHETANLTQSMSATTAVQSIAQTDALIQQVFSSLDVIRYEEASEAYLDLFEHLDKSLSPEETLILTRHLRALIAILPEAERERIGLAPGLPTDELMARVDAAAGVYIVRWWRLQDTLPATPSNERLEEHLARYVSAIESFGNESDSRGYDDRGEIYIRLGEPSHQAVIELKTIDLQLNTQGFHIPENEFWVYRHVGYDAQYLFTERRKGAGYRHSLPLDMIPRNIQNSRRYVTMLLAWMEEIYGQLALYHNIYGQRFDQVAGYRTLPGANAQRPDVFARSVLNNSHGEDLQTEWRRSQTVPASYSSTYGSATALSVDVRWSRFLNTDGTTRTEVYWVIDRDALRPSRRLRRQMYREGHEPSDDYLLSLYAMQKDQTLRTGRLHQKHYLTTAGVDGQLPPRILIIPGDSTDYSLSLQWEQRWTMQDESETETTRPGARLKITTQTIDTVQALHAGGHRLEMSDIKPLALENDALPQSGSLYPYTRLSEALPLALYFEIYHLTFGSDDRVHYSVAYEVTHPGDDRPAESRAGTSYSADERTAHEHLIPDLTQEDLRKGVIITLRITDETTGEEVSRSIRFEKAD